MESNCLSAINAIIDESEIESVLILGDYTAHHYEPFYDELLHFSGEQDWICEDYDSVGVSCGTFTFISEAHGCRRWLTIASSEGSIAIL